MLHFPEKLRVGGREGGKCNSETILSFTRCDDEQ